MWAKYQSGQIAIFVPSKSLIYIKRKLTSDDYTSLCFQNIHLLLYWCAVK